jgi:hypothetical protein
MRRQVSVAWAELGPVQAVALSPAVPAARRARGVEGRGGTSNIEHRNTEHRLGAERPASREQVRQFFSEVHKVIDRAPGVGKVFHG